MNSYICAVTATDKLEVYGTDIERPGVVHLAMVMTNTQGQKVSVLLTRDQVIELGNQVQDFIINQPSEMSTHIKPTVKVRDAVIVMGCMCADLAEPHPTYGWPIGKGIRSSMVLHVSPDQKTIETKNTIYKVVD